jgi:hypothetical protein
MSMSSDSMKIDYQCRVINRKPNTFTIYKYHRTVLPVNVYENMELSFISMLDVMENSYGSYVKFRHAANVKEITPLYFKWMK